MSKLGRASLTRRRRRTRASLVMVGFFSWEVKDVVVAVEENKGGGVFGEGGDGCEQADGQNVVNKSSLSIFSGASLVVIDVNGQFPGPLLNATTNNDVIVNVVNHLDEGQGFKCNETRGRMEYVEQTV
ncbi:Monocopper oxidase-like protein SKS2 [Linum grandiflorum]